MATYAICNGSEVRLLIQTSLIETVTANIKPGEYALETEENGFPVDFYVDNGVVTRKPPQPAPFYEFDYGTAQWVDTRQLVQIRSARSAEVDQERGQRSVLPVVYGGTLFDADGIARERISGTLARLVRGDGLPVGWMGWRDYNNQMHWTNDTAQTVQTELSGLSRAIEDREQALLIAAWTHKAAIEASENPAEYDVTTGWPV